MKQVNYAGKKAPSSPAPSLPPSTSRTVRIVPNVSLTARGLSHERDKLSRWQARLACSGRSTASVR